MDNHHIIETRVLWANLSVISRLLPYTEPGQPYKLLGYPESFPSPHDFWWLPVMFRYVLVHHVKFDTRSSSMISLDVTHIVSYTLLKVY